MVDFEQNRRNFLQNTMFGVTGAGLGLSQSFGNEKPVQSPSTSFPEGLQTPENLAKVRQGVKEWSQLVAWLWSPFLAFTGDGRQGEERQLKEFLSSLLHGQARYTNVANHYGDPQAALIAQATGETLKKSLMGEQTAPGIRLTWPEVYKQLTGKESLFTDKNFCNLFRFEVAVDTFVGGVREDEAKQALYVSTLAYPPRPELNQYTVTEQQLHDWMRDRGDGDYIPPSSYMPIAGS